MRTIAFVSSTGGVGKTSLVYHLSHMLSRLGYPTLAVDLDPQATLSSWFLGEKHLEELWEKGSGTIFSCVSPRIADRGENESLKPLEITETLQFVPGDPAIWNLELPLSEAWAGCHLGSHFAFQVTSVFHRVVQQSGQRANSTVALLDLGDSLGAINRAALLAADFLVFPLAVDTFSLHGLKILGPVIKEWRQQWIQLRENFQGAVDGLPQGNMSPAGYVTLRLNSFQGRIRRSHARWLDQIPAVYSGTVLGEAPPGVTVDEDPHCLAVLRNYGSLMSMAQEARKPMFDLRPADGAMGSYSQIVWECEASFKALATRLAERCGLER